MKKNVILKIVAISTVILLPSLVCASKIPGDVQKAKILHKTYRMQIPFIENKGQIANKAASFYAKTFGGTLFVEKDGTLTYSFSAEDKGGVVIKEIIAEKKVEVRGLEPSPTRVNYFKGKDQSKWKTNIPSFNSVSLGEVYEGIELKLKAYGKNVEKLFTVLPKANPGVIKINLQGAKELKVNQKGELEVITERGPITFTKPLAYQKIDGTRVEVNVSYNIQQSALNDQLSASGIPHSAIRNLKGDVFYSPLTTHCSLLTYGFNVGKYNKNYPLVIDPLLASTFLGGTDDDFLASIALDGSGNVYVVGSTTSTDFPTIPGAYDTTCGTDGFCNYDQDNYKGDVFVSKLDSTLSTLLASTFIGGGGYDSGYSLRLDGSGNVYVAGSTSSPDYPATPGAYDTTCGTDGNCNYDGLNYKGDVFISKLNSDLSSLLLSTFIGGSEGDSSDSITLDGSGNVYVTGETPSSDYPTTTGAYDETLDGLYDVFVSKLDSTLSTLLASTFIGSSSNDSAESFALDGSGNVYVVGRTSSSDFPTTPGAYDTSYSFGFSDSFVSKLDGTLSTLVASTFVGAESPCDSIALDANGNVYVTCQVSFTFPTTPGAYDESFNGAVDASVAKINSDLSNLEASTYIGGSIPDSAQSLTLDGCGNVYVAGWTVSSDFPTTSGAYDESYNGSAAFVSKLDNSLGFLLASTFIDGGNSVPSIILDGSGNVYVAGNTNSSEFPTTSGAYDTNYNGAGDNFYGDVFVSKLDSDLSADSGFLSSESSFLFDPFAVSLKFDVDQDGVFDVPCTELLLCKDQVVDIDIWLDNWDSVGGGEVTGVSFNLTATDFTWDEDVLQVESITCDPQWDASCTITHTPGTTTYLVEMQTTSGGFSGPKIKLSTVRLRCIGIITPVSVTFTIDSASITSTLAPPESVEESQLRVSAICGDQPLTCSEEDHCEQLSADDICLDTGVTEKENRYYWEPLGTTPLYEGDAIIIYHTRTGDQLVTTGATETLCDSECFTNCYENCGYIEIQVCYLGCLRGCTCNHCLNWSDEEVCYEYTNRINCNVECYSQCAQSYDSATDTAQYNKRCGYALSETITMRAGDDGDCLTGEVVDTFTLQGAGTAAINRSLPLTAGSYKICAGDILIGDMVTVEASGEPACRIMIPTSSLSTNQGEDTILEGITLEADIGDTYLLSLEWRDHTQNPLPVPPSLTLPTPEEIVLTGGIGQFDLSVLNPQPYEGEVSFPNVIIRAVEKAGQSVECEAMFDYEILPPPNQCAADTNGDCKVNLTDLVTMKGEFLRSDCDVNPCQADCNGDDKVNLSDLVIMKGEFLFPDCCP